MSRKKLDRSNVERILPLTPIQEGMLFQYLKDPSTKEYVEMLTVRFNTAVDISLFKKTWKCLVRQNEMLRTVFRWEGINNAVQIILKEAEPAIDFIEDAGTHHSVPAFPFQPFDLEEIPFRILLERKSHNVYDMTIANHHILYDGWSSGILLKEFVEVYLRLKKTGKYIPKEKTKFEDFIDLLKNEERNAAAKMFWREYCSGFTEYGVLEGNPDHSGMQEGWNKIKLHLAPGKKDEINDFIKKNGVTLSSFLYSAWGIVLQNFQNTADTIFGTTVSGRFVPLKGITEMVGLFINTLPLRITSSPGKTIADLVKQVHSVLIARSDHEQMPLTDINRLSGLEPMGSLFNTIMVIENYPVDQLLEKGNELDCELLTVGGTTNYDLTVTVMVLNREDIEIDFSYKRNRFHSEFIRKVSRSLENVLSEIIAKPRSSIQSFSILSATEREVLARFNDTAAEYPTNKTVVELFEEQVEKTPEHISVIHEGESMTYRELNESANRLAHYLRSTYGISGDDRVAIMMGRSAWLMVAILGVLKAGAAYVPIDRAYPQARKSFMLADAQPKALIIDSESLPEIAQGVEPLAIDERWDDLCNSGWSSQNPDKNIDAGNLAYVMYTSGSTGRPKGVLVEHRNVVSLVRGSGYIDLNDQDRLLVTGSLSFDATTFEYWGMLLNGGRLILCEEPSLLDNDALKEVVRKHAVTKMWLTAGWFNQLVEENIGLFDGVKIVIAGGDRLSPVHIEKLYDHNKDIRVINGYGPTENTTFSLSYEIKRGDEHSRSIPIGKPLSNRSAWILNGNRGLCGIGMTGEIYAGGAGVARGYLNQVELTQEKFTENQFMIGERLYRTGDLGRWLPDGNIEFLGRKDEQVKIRGYRIELGEIESVLSAQPGVKGCCVIAKEDGSGNRKLVGYVVPEDMLNKKRLEDGVIKVLPEYMVPRIWVELETLPLTPNGKVDKKALPDPSGVPDHEYIAPRNGVEEQLAAIWSELLSIQQVGIHDNFFEQGGDSIITIQVASRAQKLGISLRPRDLFEHQTIAELSAHMRGNNDIWGEQGLLTGASDLLPIQQYFFEQEYAQPWHYNQSVLLQIEKSIPSTQLEQLTEALVQQHDSLRLRFRFAEGKYEQWYGPVISCFYEEVNITSFEEICARYQGSMDLHEGPLFKVVLIHTKAGDAYNRLYFVGHHLVVDGVSWRILLEDMENGLSMLRNGNSPVFGKKSHSYREYARLLEEFSRSKLLEEEELKYWRRIVSGCIPLQTDKQNNSGCRRKDAAHYIIRINAILTEQLIKGVHHAYQTEINDILLATLGKSLSDHQASALINFGLEGHGRELIMSQEQDISRTVGWFTNLYPVRLEVAADADAGELIKSVKEQLRTIPGKGMGFGVLRYLHRSKEVRNSLQHQYLFDVVFNYLGQLDNVTRKMRGFSEAPEPVGPHIGQDNFLENKLAVNGHISGGELVLTWTYDSLQYEASTIKELAESYGNTLQLLIEHCRQVARPSYTSSDYGLPANENFRELNTLQAMPNNLYPLSGLQEGLLFHGVYDKANRSYITQFKVDMGAVEIETFRKSWEYLINRYSILRTGFYHKELSIPVQRVHTRAQLPLEMIDWQGLMPEEQAQKEASFLKEDAENGFDFSAPPLMRITMLQLAENRYRMIWTIHHLILDGWSVSLLMSEFMQLYRSYSLGEEVIPAHEDHYRDYIKYIGRIGKYKEESFWRDYLREYTTPSLLPFVKNDPQRNKGIGTYNNTELVIDQVRTRRIKAMAQENHLTLNTVVQAVWALLLSRYNDQEDVLFGVTVSGRPGDLRRAEERVGLYINILPLRSLVTAEKNIIEWLTELQTGHGASREHQYGSLSKLQQRYTGHTGDWFDSVLTFENYPVSEMLKDQIGATGKKIAGGIDVMGVNVKEHTNYPLSLAVLVKDTIKIDFVYNSRLLDEETIGRIKGHFQQVLLEIGYTQQCSKIGEIRFLTVPEEEILLARSQSKHKGVPFGITMVDRFREQVSRTPDHLAVIGKGEAITYRELEERSNQLASYLRKRGVGPEVLVPIYTGRYANMVIGILGILKAGGAYVPIDPELPLERIRYMLRDTAAELLVCSSDQWNTLENGDWKEVVLLDADREWIDREPDTSFDNGIHPQNLAYMIYTSGSTGRPRGVAVDHANLNHFSSYVYDRHLSQGPLHMPFTASYGFDISIFQLCCALLSGGACLIAEKEDIQDMQRFTGLLKGANCIDTVPAVYRSLLHYIEEHGLQEAFGHIKAIFIGGDSVPDEILIRIRKIFNRARIAVLYGPTEGTIFCTDALYDAVPGKGSTIGRPILANAVYILGSSGQLAPDKLTGEICLGGAGIARGYLNQPEQTAEKFTGDPFKKGGRLYKTGDLGCWQPDETIRFVGRKDQQVKIRGFRIEPGEIERVLSAQPGVKGCCVVAKEDGSGNKRLVGYVVTQGGLNKKRLEDGVSNFLPEYMVPRTWIELEALPLTPNGKIDKKALPDPSGLPGNEYIAPRNSVEEQLAVIWSELLLIERIGIHDNFFELGGDSIITIQVVSRAQKHGIVLQPRDLFMHQTIAELSTHMRANGGSDGEQGLLEGRSDLLPIQHYFFEQEYAQPWHYNQSVLLRIEKSLPAATLAQLAEGLFRQHDSLRLQYIVSEGKYVQWYGPVVNCFYEEPSARDIREVCERYQQSLNLHEGPLFKIVLIRTGDEDRDNRLLLVGHHLLVDGVSWRILLEDIENGLTLLMSRKELELGNKSFSFRQYAEKLVEFSRSTLLLGEELEYWHRIVSDSFPVRADKENVDRCRMSEVANYVVKISAGQTEQLVKKLSHVYQTEIADMLLCALGKVLCHYQQSKSIVFALERHGREPVMGKEYDPSRTVGWFTNLFPVRLLMDPAADPEDIIPSVKEQLRAIPDKGLGFGVLRYLHPSAEVRNSLHREHLYDVVFNYLGQLDNATNTSRWLSMVTEGSGTGIAPDNTFNHKLFVNTYITGGELVVDWHYDSRSYEIATIKQLAEKYILALQELITHCLQSENRYYTPSDYGLPASVHYSELTHFLNVQKEDILPGNLYPLSASQTGMLFHGLYSNESKSYIMQMKVDVSGLDVQLVEKSWEYLLSRYSILRTGFHYKELGVPFQRVHKKVLLPVKVIDWRSFSPQQQARKEEVLLQEDMQRGFDFSLPPLMRVTILQLSDTSFRLIWTVHHILLDGWSLSLLMGELMSAYRLLLNGHPVPASKEDQYGDFIKYLSKISKYGEEPFWRAYLQGCDTPTILPFGANQKERNKGIGTYVRTDLIIDAPATAIIKEYANANHLTVNTVIQGVWALLLSKYCGQQDVVFGVTVSGRPADLVATESRVGLYINMLPLRSKITADINVTEWLMGLQTAHSSAREFQYGSLAEIQQRYTSVTGDWFDSILTYENFPVSELLQKERLAGSRPFELTGISISENNNYAFTVNVTMADTLTIVFIYNNRLVEKEYAERIKGHFEKILTEIAITQKKKTGDIVLLTMPEEEELLAGFNTISTNIRADKTLIELFDEQVDRTPDNIAVIYEGKTITYRELDTKANQLAHYLRKKNVKQEVLTGICADRSIEMVLSILSILKAGGAWVPVDPEWPDNRIDYIIEDAGLKLIVNYRHNEFVEYGKNTCEQIWIDDKTYNQEATKRPATALHGRNLAYVIYTSGSTGKPKGTLVEHRSIVNELLHYSGFFGYNSTDKQLLIADYTFDASIEQMFLPLLNGGTLVLANKETLQDPVLLKHLLEQEKITHIQATPTFLATISPGKYSALKRVCSGGEACPAFLAKAWSPYVRFFNKYGPTEAAVNAGCYPYDPAAKHDMLLPIGKPLRNVSLHILGKQKELLPTGIKGEIYIGGIQLARGYLNNAELTSEIFIENPFIKGDRLYRTGDQGRLLPDGNIEFIGRNDEQVKIRGYRIELGEIESVLAARPGVKGCCVMSKEDGTGNKRLVGYVVTEGGLDKRRLEDELSSLLPEYMVPRVWVELEALPLTTSGKINKKALPYPSLSGVQVNEYVAPRNGMEEQLVAIWTELLSMERIGIHDNFFELGGDSIITIQVVSRALKRGISLRPRDLFEHQTIAELSANVRINMGSEGEQGLLAGVSELLPIQHYFFEQRYAQPWHYNQSILLSIEKSISADQLQQLSEVLFRQHDSLRFHYNVSEEIYEQRYGPVVNCFYEETAATDIQQICEQYQQSLDLHKGPLFKMLLIRAGEEEKDNRLFLVAHHLVVDGVSWRILLEDVESGLSQLREGQPLIPVRKSLSYGEYAKALLEFSRSKLLEEEENLYWRRIVEDCVAFRTDKQHAAPCTMKTLGSYELKIAASKTDGLIKGVNQVYQTEINDLLLAALGKSLGNYQENDSVIFGLEGHGREDVMGRELDISRTIGWFTNLYPVRLVLEADADAGMLLKSVKEQLRAIPGKGIGFGVLRYLHGSPQVREGLRHEHLYDVVFNYLGQLDNMAGGRRRLHSAPELTGPGIGPGNIYHHKISITAYITKGELTLQWNYDSLRYEAATIKELAQSYSSVLEELIVHCRQAPERYYTPSDFGLPAVVGYHELDSFLRTQQEKIRPGEMYALSGLQEGLLFHGLYSDNSSAYISQIRVLVEKPEIAIIEKCWNYLIDKYSILRTSFHYQELSIPVQRVHTQVSLPMVVVDLRGLLPGARKKQEDSFLKEDIEKGFDFSVAPLMRIRILRVSDDRYSLICTVHHIILDGWSMSLLMGEFLMLYRTYAIGEVVPEKLKDHYGDYIQLIGRIDRYKEEAFWREYLREQTNPVLLPFVSDQKDRNMGIGDYRHIRLVTGTGETEKLKEYTQQHRITFNTLVQGVWALLLSWYTGLEDIIYGVTVSGRPAELPGMEERVGLYINMLPFRSKVSAGMDLAEWLTGIQAGHSAAREHQYGSLRKLQQRYTGITGDWFDSVLTFENYPVSELLKQESNKEVSYRLKLLEVNVTEHDNYVLSIVVNAAAVITIEFIYNSRLLKDEYAEMIRGHFAQVLTEIANTQQVKIGAIKCLSPLEEKLLAGFNANAAEYPSDKTVVQLFEEQVEKVPDQIAVIHEGESMTYQELNERANRLAHCLRACYGIRADDRVAIMMDRSAWLTVTILGVLKAGAAYVPIDKEYPQARKSFMLADSQPKVLIIEPESLSEIADQEIKLLTIDEKWKDSSKSGWSSLNPEKNIDGKNLAYVIYTSGSTGRPKGVLVEHRQILSFVLGNNFIDYEKVHVVAGISNYVFDGSIFDIFFPLLNGKQLALLDISYSSLDLSRLADQFFQYHVDTVFVTTALFNALVTSQSKCLDQVQQLLFGGEACNIAIVNYFKSRYPNASLIHVYGPTENIVYSTYCRLNEYNTQDIVPIGTHLSDKKIYISDNNQSPVPIGITGELCIGGAGIARGYLNEVELTYEKFIESPFEDGERLYRTGDLCRWLPDGNIEFIGRNDDQVKVRGYRIELSEIESVLSDQPGVKSCCVVAKEDGTGNRRLAGYLVMEGQWSKHELEEELSKVLPEYMVPRIWVELDALPLTANGKINKKALPDPPALPDHEYVAPRNEVEEQLAAIWCGLLGVERVGIHDNFFELGGDSIITIQVVSRAQKQGITLRPRNLFEHQTIAQLSAYVGANSDSEGEQGIVEGTSDLLPIQHYFFEQGYAAPWHFNQSVLLRIEKRIPATALQQLSEALFRQHDSLRFQYNISEGKYEQRYGPVVNCFYEETEVMDLEAVCERHQRSFNLQEGPLFRVVLIRTEGDDPYNRLFLVAHHLVVDGVSWRILLEDMESGLTMLQRDNVLVFAKKSHSYREYAKLLREFSRSKLLEEEQWKYWRRIVSGCVPLRTDKQCNMPCRINEAKNFPLKLNTILTEQLIKGVNQVYQTEINDFLLTALAKTLSNYQGSTSVVFGLEGHGREDVMGRELNISRTVGWFTNLYPVRLEVEANAEMGELLKSVKEQLRGIPGKGMGFGVLRYLHESEEIRDSLRHEHLYDVVFNYLGQIDNITAKSSWLSGATEKAGPGIAANIALVHKLLVNCHITRGELVLTWTYDCKRYEPSTIKKLAVEYANTLQLLIEHCRKTPGRYYTPSDYGLPGVIPYTELDAFLSAGEVDNVHDIIF